MGRVALGLVLAGLLSTRCWAADEEIEITPDVVYGHKDGMALTYDVFRPKESANGLGVLFMVSGGWHSHWSPPESRLAFFQPMLARGFTVLAVRHGSAPRYKVPEAVADVRRAVRHIRLHAADYQIDPERLGVYGMSAGGHLSLVLATTADAGHPAAKDEVLRQSSRVAAAVAYYPPSDLRQWVTGEEPRMRTDYPALQFASDLADDVSPLLHVTRDDAPTLLIHGDKDRLVPIEHSLQQRTAMEKAGVPCELITIEGAAHGFKGEDAQRAVNAQVAWFEKFLRAAAGTVGKDQ
ncbi:MAG: alpha/beta hydrolase [Pirellulales bacterium]|jgi:acetyl esterase/lipase|nr:alpha/beta hydrolase [Thermoguttaceae bacterium]MDD4785722.1 alpha/beta hydrolase [Pirellulales bacterium]MDI9444618.1 alpha/beta hydrolase [Planctomycetota bacterium]NLZ02185.1 alpha/beta hydrolase [Pirellulaceae bacterium]